jgi:hypothetical protein
VGITSWSSSPFLAAAPHRTLACDMADRRTRAQRPPSWSTARTTLVVARPLSQLQALLTPHWTDLANMGMKVYACTLAPRIRPQTHGLRPAIDRVQRGLCDLHVKRSSAAERLDPNHAESAKRVLRNSRHCGDFTQLGGCGRSTVLPTTQPGMALTRSRECTIDGSGDQPGDLRRVTIPHAITS